MLDKSSDYKLYDYKSICSFKTIILFFDAVSLNAGLMIKLLRDFNIKRTLFYGWQDINSMNMSNTTVFTARL